MLSAKHFTFYAFLFFHIVLFLSQIGEEALQKCFHGSYGNGKKGKSLSLEVERMSQGRNLNIASRSSSSHHELKLRKNLFQFFFFINICFNWNNHLDLTLMIERVKIWEKKLSWTNKFQMVVRWKLKKHEWIYISNILS